MSDSFLSDGKRQVAESGSFLKKNQKTFAVWAEPTRKGRRRTNQKRFAWFFSKKKSFLATSCATDLGSYF
jgi:hypothetical protein